MIRMISGVLGYHNGTTVVPITSKDGPISIAPDVEKHLVECGRAEYVNEPASAASNEVEPSYSSDMKLEELKALAEQNGIDASKMRSKAEVIAALDAAITDEEDAPPEFGAADPV